jgi:hypothetical protein
MDNTFGKKDELAREPDVDTSDIPHRTPGCCRRFYVHSKQVAQQWVADLMLPHWMLQLQLESKDIRGKFGRAALLPVVVVLALIAAIYNSGQLRALAIALTAPLGPVTDPFTGGFGASYEDLALWILSCGMLSWSWFLYFAEPESRALDKPPLAEMILMHWIWPILILAPFFVSKVTWWNGTVLLFLVSSGPMYMMIGGLGGWHTWAGFLALLAATVLFLHELPRDASILGIAGTICVIAVPLLVWFQKKKMPKLWRVIAALYCSAAAINTAVAPIFAESVLSAPAARNYSFNPHALVLGLWWIAPGVMLTLVSKLPAHWRNDRGAKTLLILGLVSSILIAFYPDSVFGLTTLCLAAAMLLSVGSLLRHERARLYRHIAAYVGVAAIVVACWDLGPHPVPGPLPTEQRLGHARQSEFDGFYRRWLAARGETPEQHGPVLLVAVAGGGIRAAAHATLALATADDTFKGKFGDRTLAISSVSGGALGVATWLGQRTEHLPVTKSPMDPAPTAWHLSRFYQKDFVSPTLNRLLVHDLPLGALPWLQQSDRDSVLARAWASSWDELRRAAKLPQLDQNIFRRTVASLRDDPALPLAIFNATSAADGRPAVYSSIRAKFHGAWLLDPSVSVMDAVTDSARFAVVSPVGHRCALPEATPPLHSASALVTCNKPLQPIAVADGGYNDNSGLASLETILDELASYDRSLKDVYVVVIRSNPELGLRLEEGRRFDQGRAIPELLAPLAVLDNARSAHSDLFAERWERRLGPGRVITWDLDYAKFASRTNAELAGSSKGFLNRRADDVEALRRLQLAPLGWTLDRESFHNLRFQSITTSYISSFTECATRLPQYGLLCRTLPTANSPQK